MVFKKKKKDAAGADADEEKKPAEEGKEAAEGESAEGAASPEEEAKARKKKLMLIVAGALVLLLVLGGAGAYFMGVFGHSEHAKKPGGSDMNAGENKPVYFDLPQILVNLNTGGKTTSFVKTTVTLELVTPTDVPILQANLPRLMDNYNTFLREMKASDLYGSAGVYRLREEMLVRANKVLAPAKVKDVLFREILVQ